MNTMRWWYNLVAGLLLSTLTFSYCKKRPPIEINDNIQQVNTPRLVQALSVLKEDGYSHGHRRVPRFGIPKKQKPVAGQNYYLLDFASHWQMRNARMVIKNHHGRRVNINRALLGRVKKILAVIVTRQYGSAWKYEHSDIKIEQWIYDSPDLATRALAELKNLNRYGFGKKWARFFTIGDSVYYCDVRSSTKVTELVRVVQKVRPLL